MVVVDYEELPSVADLRAALAGGAPQLFPEAPGNIALDWPGPVPDDGSNAREIEAIFSGAAHTARVSTVNQRLDRQHHGATRRDRALRCGDRQLHAALVLARRGPATRSARRRHRLPARKAARHHRGRRRRVRPEDGGLSGISVPAGRREAHRPAGRLDGDALGVVPVGPACARHRDRSRACDRREGKIPGVAREASRRDGRLHRRSRRAHPDQQFLALLSRHVRDPARPGRRAVRVHQYGADRALIAAPGGRRRTTRWSAWSTRPRASPASIRCGCAGAT